jgi:hypothetical protein
MRRIASRTRQLLVFIYCACKREETQSINLKYWLSVVIAECTVDLKSVINHLVCSVSLNPKIKITIPCQMGSLGYFGVNSLKED